MPIAAAAPNIIDGNSYPYYAVQLIISAGIEPTNIAARLVINLTPYRVLSDGVIEARQDQMKTYLASDAFTKAQTDPVLAAALVTQSELIQAFIVGKGL